MGTQIDEISPASYPDYYADSTDAAQQKYHIYRQLLNSVMCKAGFRRHPNEWWHFSLGDQMWAWAYNQENPAQPMTARYGRLV
jgi:D-alanyl-D-alanine dipeptidase